VIACRRLRSEEALLEVSGRSRSRRRLLRFEGVDCLGRPVLNAKILTIFEGTSEIQRMITGRAVTGLDVR
jgi:alkylation response protein AidB-like acyl-CoA dehydrogenase